ncbi:hypothetical protein GCT13_41220 [Paraburkholderia sp. CNPSo 3157]|uniref:FAD/NAD(P)-binding domain-containing protein n=1 Tax=Paraburkholderia franconis TaxID=2654983 RepID=A0A7X1NJK5_9BURK|nr:hypothetical protein [Paraburkholderia franconis]
MHYRQQGDEAEQSIATHHLFLFIGAQPNTSWLQTCGVEVDSKGFVLTRTDVPEGAMRSLPLQTSVDGVFAIGDVRAGSIKRVAAAVGEGAAVVAQIHSFLTATAR